MTDGTERIRFTNGIVFRGESVAPGDEADVTPREAFLLCEGYKDAVRVDGTGRKATSTTANLTEGLEIVHGDPAAEHRDPVIKPASQSRRRA